MYRVFTRHARRLVRTFSFPKVQCGLFGTAAAIATFCVDGSTGYQFYGYGLMAGSGAFMALRHFIMALDGY